MNIRKIKESDRNAVIDLMRKFFASDAVHTDGTEAVFESNINECLSGSPYLEGYVFTRDDGSAGGYAMVSHTYNTEYGMPAVWIEDIYLDSDLRGYGLADRFFDMIRAAYPAHLHRLEVDKGNERALKSYRKNGFEEMLYAELVRIP